MNGAKFRWVGLGLLSGAALAVGCGGDEGGGGGGNSNSTTITSSVTTTIGNVTNNVNSATSSQSTNGTSNGTASGTTGSGTTGSTTGSGTTGSGTTGSTTTGSTTTGSTTTGSTTTGSTTGSGGAGGSCEDDAPAPTGGNAAGAGGEGGASGSEELSEGFNFVDESEVGAWSITPCADGAANCFDEATVSFSCGVMRVEVSWPEGANTEAKRLQLQHVVSESMLYDLSGKTLYLRVRMTSASAADHGYDFNMIAQDFIDDDDDSNDWKWFSTCYNGSGSCPDNPSGETYTTDAWVPVALPMREDLAPEEFAFDSVRKLAIEIGTKHWAGPTFNYDDAPTSFEIDYVAW